MRISVKARYGLTAVICIAQNYNSNGYITIISLAEKLKISKIYLEQVFSLLKRADIVISTKGAQGGYKLARTPKDIKVLEILSAVETALFEKTETTVLESNVPIEKAVQKKVYEPLDDCVTIMLSNITLADLVSEVEKQSSDEGYMYYL